MRAKNDYYEESTEGVSAVLDRMVKALGNPPGSYAMALDVSENTIKTWRRRGEVSMKYLRGFADVHSVSIDFLMYGDSARKSTSPAETLTANQKKAGYSVEVLSKEEQALLDNYRHSPPDGQAAIKATSAAFAQSKQVKKGKAA